jgi:hypothetical protein
MVAGIPEVLSDFNMYNAGNVLAGITGQVTMPNLEAATQEISGAGILGSYNVASPGRFGSIEQAIPFRLLNRDAFNLFVPNKDAEVVLRGSQQHYDPSTGATKQVGMRVIFRGRPTKITLGNATAGSPTDSSVTLELTYLKVEIDGADKVELDKVNGQYKVNGVDMLAAIKLNC